MNQNSHINTPHGFKDPAFNHSEGKIKPKSNFSRRDYLDLIAGLKRDRPIYLEGTCTDEHYEMVKEWQKKVASHGLNHKNWNVVKSSVCACGRMAVCGFDC